MSATQQQFADEWKKVSAVVESEARRQLLTLGYLDYSMLNNVLRDERDMWFKSHSARQQWLEELGGSGDLNKVKVTTKIRQTHLQDIYHVGKKRISMIGLKVLYLMLSLLAGCLIWLGLDFYFSPSKQEYLASPLKWIAFPLLAMVLAYTFCLPKVAQSKEEKMQELIRAVTEEVGALGSELLLLMQPPKG